MGNQNFFKILTLKIRNFKERKCPEISDLKINRLYPNNAFWKEWKFQNSQISKNLNNLLLSYFYFNHLYSYAYFPKKMKFLRTNVLKCLLPLFLYFISSPLFFFSPPLNLPISPLPSPVAEAIREEKIGERAWGTTPIALLCLSAFLPLK